MSAGQTFWFKKIDEIISFKYKIVKSLINNQQIFGKKYGVEQNLSQKAFNISNLNHFTDLKEVFDAPVWVHCDTKLTDNGDYEIFLTHTWFIQKIGSIMVVLHCCIRITMNWNG